MEGRRIHAACLKHAACNLRVSRRCREVRAEFRHSKGHWQPCQLGYFIEACVEIVGPAARGKIIEPIPSATGERAGERDANAVLTEQSLDVAGWERGHELPEIHAPPASTDSTRTLPPRGAAVQLRQVEGLGLTEAGVEGVEPQGRQGQTEGPNAPDDDRYVEGASRGVEERAERDQLLDPVVRGTEAGRLHVESGDRDVPERPESSLRLPEGNPIGGDEADERPPFDRETVQRGCSPVDGEVGHGPSSVVGGGRQRRDQVSGGSVTMLELQRTRDEGSHLEGRSEHLPRCVREESERSNICECRRQEAQDFRIDQVWHAELAEPGQELGVGRRKTRGHDGAVERRRGVGKGGLRDERFHGAPVVTADPREEVGVPEPVVTTYYHVPDFTTEDGQSTRL